MITINNYKAADIKLHLLSTGISFSESFIHQFATNNNAMEKRRAYNDSDEHSLSRKIKIPQEIFISNVVIAVNYKRHSPWQLEYNSGDYFLSHQGKYITSISFPKRPSFFDISVTEALTCGQVANLYGGSSLAFFTPSTCYYFNKGKECHFCSLKPNRDQESQFIDTITPQLAASVLKIALKNDSDLINQIMLVGGNHPNYDIGFQNHLKIASKLDEEQFRINSSKKLETHIATMPPNDFNLIDELKSLNARMTLNMEVFDDDIFTKICPGKTQDYGRQLLIDALKYAVKIVGDKRIHTILIAGLEPVESTIKGIRYLASIGITPIINVFHNDRGSYFENHSRPSYQDLLKIALVLQEVYQQYNLIPYWKGCGRNALDYEALQGWFST
ncbi:hypothetical protein FJR38_26030 [Anabaena sp. UHCC 0253]|uniref:radical SAM protein n=1 Tax=Anabaena sp. UHCC 0253 TaxID=2590019 RepID=UPI0014483E94|nr:radical SAM protein [Anabaena sp. UHCC 0253]MTJ55873.1 hypothetical protein [Anabaena sp. UHCC 0253]